MYKLIQVPGFNQRKEPNTLPATREWINTWDVKNTALILGGQKCIQVHETFIFHFQLMLP